MPKVKASLKAELTPCAQAMPWQSRVPSPGRTAALLSPPHSSACSCCHGLGQLWPGPGSLGQADPKACRCPQHRQVPRLPPVPPSAQVSALEVGWEGSCPHLATTDFSIKSYKSYKSEQGLVLTATSSRLRWADLFCVGAAVAVYASSADYKINLAFNETHW